ncbi:MAG TPA: class I SAM-dependent rRNA methyltransferase, partial [Roseimicrobium sp.]|nr:class I SAM-dependent rRNA methyltransferase [Roseimicrobium sp.]
PWVQMKYYSFHPCIFPSMIMGASRDAEAGSLVNVYDRDGQPFGQGLYHPRAKVPLRVLYHGQESLTEDFFLEQIDRALDLRFNVLKLPEITDSYRAIHSDGDGLSGLVVDKYNDVLAVEVHSYGMYQRLEGWLPRLHERLGTTRTVVSMDERVARVEGIRANAKLSDPVRVVKIREHGVRFEVDFAEGHKTGFFCDQRENRHMLKKFTQDKRVLDLCCYTGGFSISAMVGGGAADVTGVDLDEKAIAQAKRNANLNQVRVNWAHCDAFSYARQMQRNGEQWDVVVLDPPKLVLSRMEQMEGEKKYTDLNMLGMSLVKPGGLFVTCSCSGLLQGDLFEQLVCKAAHRQGRRLQIIDRTGPGGDHPVMSNCPEGRYLKLLWGRVF